jgi:hypothetical protein
MVTMCHLPSSYRPVNIKRHMTRYSGTVAEAVKFVCPTTADADLQTASHNALTNVSLGREAEN